MHRILVSACLLGPGVTTARLLAAGIRVFSEHELAAADACLRALDEAAPD